MTSSPAPGVLVIEGFLDRSRCERLRAAATALAADAFRAGQPISIFDGDGGTHDQDPRFLESGDGAVVFHEPAAASPVGWDDYRAGVARIGHGLHVAVPEVSELVADERLGAIVRDLGRARPAVIESLFLLKGSRTEELDVHIDHTYLWTDPPSVALLWLALEDADEANGCLLVDPRGPVEQPRARLRRAAGGTVLEGHDPMPAHGELLLVPARQGDLVVVDGRVPHASGPGAPDGRSRDALGLHVVDLDAALPDDLFLGRIRPVALPG